MIAVVLTLCSIGARCVSMPRGPAYCTELATYLLEHNDDTLNNLELGCVQEFVVGLIDVVLDPAFEPHRSQKQNVGGAYTPLHGARELPTLHVHMLASIQLFVGRPAVFKLFQLHIMPRISDWFDDLVKHQRKAFHLETNQWVFFRALGKLQAGLS